jgi:putative flippase GtrA
MIFSNSLIQNKIFRFLFVGGITFLIYYFFIWLFFERLEIKYLYSISISYLIAVSLHFFLNRTLTFNSNKNNLKLHLIKYSMVSILNYLIQFFVIYIAYNFLSFNIYLSVLISIITTIVIGYLLMDIWVFKRVNNDNC